VFYFPISKLTFGIAVAYQFAGRALLALDGFKMAVEALSPEFYHGGLGFGREHKYFLRSKNEISLFLLGQRGPANFFRSSLVACAIDERGLIFRFSRFFKSNNNL
jgi:hypothetical protein